MTDLNTMYPPQKDSPYTVLTGDILAGDTVITVQDASVFPAPPFPVTFGFDGSVTEVGVVTDVDTGTDEITVTRPSGMVWPGDTKLARVFNADDLQVVQDNLTLLETHSNDESNPHAVTAVQVGAPTEAEYDAHVANESNPHVVTAAQVGAATSSDLATHMGNTTNPHVVTAAQVGAPTEAEYDAHVANVSNPHAVTAAQVGAPTEAEYDAHVANESNPHVVTAAQVGAATAVDLSSHTNNTNNPHNVNATQVGAIPTPSSPTEGDILRYSGSAWGKLNGRILVAYTYANLNTDWSGTNTSWATVKSLVTPALQTGDLLVVSVFISGTEVRPSQDPTADFAFSIVGDTRYNCGSIRVSGSSPTIIAAPVHNRVFIEGLSSGTKTINGEVKNANASSTFYITAGSNPTQNAFNILAEVFR